MGKIELGDGNSFVTEELSEDENNLILKHLPAGKRRHQELVRLTPGNWIIFERYITLGPFIYNFKFRPDDVVVMTFMKSGTTWVQELAWTMSHNPDLDHPRAKEIITERSRETHFDLNFTEDVPFDKNHPGFDIFNRLCPGKNYKNGVYLQLCEADPGPRVLKSHLPFAFYKPDMLDNCKVIYVARNPYDVAVSAYHFSRYMLNVSSELSFDDTLECLLQDAIIFGPYWSHIKEAWKRRCHPNLHFVYFEDLKKNPEVEIRKMDEFMGTKLNDQQIKNVLFQTSFENMKKMEQEGDRPPMFSEIRADGGEGGFFRKGKVGSWKESLSADQREKISNWIKENTKDCDIKLKYE